MIEAKFIAAQEKVIKREIKRLESEIKEDQKYEDVGTTNDDSALEFESFEEKLAFQRNAKAELADYRYALSQIEKGTYGVCQKGGEQIEIGRLKAYPAARFCATHAGEK